MVHYRRARTAGGSFFFTLVLRDRSADTLIRHFAELREAFCFVKRNRAWRTDAMVVLPDHLHVLWTLPEGDEDYPGRWRAIKSRFVGNLRRSGVPVHFNAKGEADIWQRRFWEHQIRDEEDFARHVDYIHINPVKHGYAERAIDWRWSSLHRYVRLGIFSQDWAAQVDATGKFGE